MTAGTARVVRLARAASLLLVVAATLAACLDDRAPSAAPTPTRQPEPTPVTTTYALATTVWYEGLLLHFDRATAILDDRGGPVEVLLRLENNGTEQGDLNAPIRLVIGGEPVEPTRESRVPSVPPDGLEGASMRWELQGVSSVDDAVIEVGADPLHVARVPLSAAAGETVDLEPVTMVLDGRTIAGDLRIHLREGVLRWDLPDWSQELESDLQALTLTYDVTYLGAFGGGFAFTGDNVVLRMPDGSRVGPRRDGHSQSVELIGSNRTTEDLFSRFEIPAGLAGRYTLIVRDGTAESGIEFTIDG